MSSIRRTASRLLGAMVDHLPAESRTWGNAALRELDFVESDWTALFWALGSTTALCRHAASLQLRIRFGRHALSLKRMATRIPAMLSGVAAGGAVLAVCLLALTNLMHASWFDPAHGKLADRLLFVAVPEAVYLASAVALWRQRKSVALGILAAGMILITHAIVHFVTHT
jgi:hypothetical protein